MSVADHKTVARAAAELWNSGNSHRPEEFFTADFVCHMLPDAAIGQRRGNSLHWDWKAVLQSYHEDVTLGNRQVPDMAYAASVKTLDEWKDLLKRYHVAFSSSNVEIVGQIAENEMVVTRWKLSAIHSGETAGASPTGNHVAWTGVATERVHDGRIVESWIDWDKYSLLLGLGLVS